MKEKIKAEIKKRAKEGRISCASARRLAEKLDVKYKDVGRAADELGIRIKNCDLGCF